MARTSTVEDEHGVLQRVTEAVNASLHFPSVLQAIAETLKPIIGLNTIGVLTIEEDRVRRRALYIDGLAEQQETSFWDLAVRALGLDPEKARERAPETYPLAGSSTEYVGRTGRGYCSPDLATNRPFPEDDGIFFCRVRRYARLPLFISDRLLGSIAFCRYDPEPFTSHDIEVFEAVSQPIATAVSRALAYEELARSEESLRQQTALLESILANVGDGVIVLNNDARFLLFNSAAQQIYGTAPGNEDFRRWAEQLGLCLPDKTTLYPVSELPPLRALRGEAVDDAEIFIRTGTGSEGRSSSIGSRPMREPGGRIIGAVAIVRDITQRKQLEDALRESECNLAEGQRLSHSGSWSLDLASGYRYWSEEMFRIFEIPSTDGPPSVDQFLERVHPEDRPSVKNMIDDIMRNPRPFRNEYRIIVPENSVKHISSVGRPVADYVGAIQRLVGVLIDSTEQHRATAALQAAYKEIESLKDRLYEENLMLKEEVDRASMFEDIVGSSRALQHVLALVEKVAKTDSTVLITGETGTGKELIARAIHRRSSRASGPFVVVNCAALPPTLITSELFGHEKGAFTGALQRRAGRFELAHRGTIFLDEIGEIPAETQVTLLRVLQEHNFERVGGTKAIHTDARVIAATNRDLTKCVAEGAFRKDLYYRLNVFPLHLPPLRERVDDIAMLVRYFVDRHSKRLGRKVRNISQRTMDLFQSYSWPGNIRELENVIERSVILSEGEDLALDDAILIGSTPPTRKTAAMPRALREQERETIESVLAATGGRVSGPTGAAARLGIPASTLESKIRTLRIDKYRFRSSG